MSPERIARVHVVVSSLALFAVVARPAGAAEPPARGDLFDVDQGTTVTSNSQVVTSVVEAIFGSPLGSPEPGTTFFADAPIGTVHFVEWSTAAPVTVVGFNLHAAGDIPNSPEKRAFDHFRLQAKVGDTFQTLYDEDVEVPYVFLDGQDRLVVSAPVAPVTAQEFRAEFTQHVQGQFTGPRILELDGFPDDSCADVNYNGSISASDALSALQASVGSRGCPLCICDVDSGGTTAASDALVILRTSVGLATELACPACFLAGSTTTSTTSTTSTSLTSTSSSTTTVPASTTTVAGSTTSTSG